MKAAVLYQLGTAPVYGDFDEPIAKEGEQIVHVKAASVKNLDKGRASGTHYASYKELPTVVGIDGVGVLDDGTKVYAQGITGMIAEKAIVASQNIVRLPDNIDFEAAAALPNAILGSAMTLKIRANMQPGQNVLINGGTGVTGMIAIQLAKIYKADKIIITGRNEAQLEKAKELGVDYTISLKQDDEGVVAQLRNLNAVHHFDIVLDYLWGKPTELILQSLKGDSVHHESTQTKIVTVGEMAGATIPLPSSVLRSSNIEMVGSGFGSLSNKEIADFNQNDLPVLMQLAADGKLTIETVVEPLSNVEAAWDNTIDSGKRLVIKIAD